MKLKTIGSKLLIIAATALVIATARPAEAKDGHGDGWHGGAQHAGWGWPGGEVWRGGPSSHDNGQHLGWYKHGRSGSGWRAPVPPAYGWHGWRPAGFLGPDARRWDWPQSWGWSGFGWGWDPGSSAWGSLFVGASIGVIVAPPLIVVPPPIYAAPPPIVAGLPYIDPSPIAAAPSPVARASPAAAAPPVGLLLGAAVPPPIVILPPPVIIVAAAPPLIILTLPAFGLFIGSPVRAVAAIGPEWRTGGYVTAGATAVGAGSTLAHFAHAGSRSADISRSLHGAAGRQAHWPEASRSGQFGGAHSGGFGSLHVAGGHESRGGGFGGHLAGGGQHGHGH
jgi:hypothetical protein